MELLLSGLRVRPEVCRINFEKKEKKKKLSVGLFGNNYQKKLEHAAGAYIQVPTFIKYTSQYINKKNTYYKFPL